MVDCWVIHPPPLDFTPSSGMAEEGLYAAVEAVAGGAQDDNFFLTSVILYTTSRSIFMAPAVGGITHGSVNTRPRAERVRTAHRQKKEP
jgi:hypothetical protein